MEKNFTCPICGAKCENLTILKNCIAEHEKAEKDSEIKQRAKQREQKIKSLEAENGKLVEIVKNNCEELKKLGVNAMIGYTTLGNMRRKTINDTKDIPKPFEKALNSKDINDWDSCAGSLEAFLKAMLGGF